MTEKSLLGELVSLFDGVTDKPCPISAVETLSVPSTRVRVTKAERSAAGGTSDVTLELIHRYRELSDADAENAFYYVERLCESAESTGRVSAVKLEGTTTLSDGAMGECRATLVCTVAATGCTLSVGSVSLSEHILSVSLRDEGIIRSSRYLERPESVRHRVGGECTLTLTVTCDGLARISRLFGSSELELVCTIGTLCVKGEFVLAELCANESLSCTLRSSGKVHYESAAAQ